MFKTREELHFPIIVNPGKHSEFTFGVHPSRYASYVKDCQASILGEADTHGILALLESASVGSVRALLKEVELIRQWIVYGLMYRIVPVEGGVKIQFGAYERIAKDTNVTLRKCSLGIGGHVEVLDVIRYIIQNEDGSRTESQIIALINTLVKSFLREATEEVSVTRGPDGPKVMPSLDVLKLIGFVSDKTEDFGYVGNIHAGVIGAYQLPEDGQFVMAEPENNRAVGWFEVDELKAIHNGTSEINHGVFFEPWSKFIIDKIDDIADLLLNQHAAQQ